MLTQTAAGYSRLCELGPIDFQAVTPDTVKQMFAAHIDAEQTTGQTTFGVTGSSGGAPQFQLSAERSVETGPA